MSNRHIWLAKFRTAPSQRAHFAIFIPNADEVNKDPNDRTASCKGTLINVVGTPMSGYVHEVKRNCSCTAAADLDRLIRIGSVNLDNTAEEDSTDETDTVALEKIALQLPAPRKNENFLVPVNDVSLSLLDLRSGLFIY